MTLWWAIAVVERAPDALPACAFDEGRIEALEVEGVTLITARLDRGAPPLETASLFRHDAMVRALAGQVPAVLPARFGAHAPDAAQWTSRLRAQSTRLREGLERVRDALQITLRARRGPELEHPPPSAHEQALGPGARFLRRRARERSPRPPGWDRLAAALLAQVRAERFERGDPRIERWRGYHLVARAALVEHRRAAETLRARVPDWDLTLGEPAPPYAFAAEVLS